jgi:hypothetical protein
MRPALVALALVAGCAGDPALECERHSATSPEGVWCSAHKNAVLRFVRSTTDVDGRRARLKWFRFEFYPAIAKVENADTIHQLALSLEKEMPTFHRFYTQEHLWAVRDTAGMNPDLRAPLMKAGFRHAVVELERELHPARE